MHPAQGRRQSRAPKTLLHLGDSFFLSLDPLLDYRTPFPRMGPSLQWDPFSPSHVTSSPPMGPCPLPRGPLFSQGASFSLMGPLQQAGRYVTSQLHQGPFLFACSTT